MFRGTPHKKMSLMDLGNNYGNNDSQSHLKIIVFSKSDYSLLSNSYLKAQTMTDKISRTMKVK